jgi:hypothetical protein
MSTILAFERCFISNDLAEFDTREISNLLEHARETLKNAPKGTAISKKYFKNALNFCQQMIANKNEIYIYIQFAIYLYDICGYYDAILFLKDSLENYNFVNNEFKQELCELYSKHDAILRRDVLSDKSNIKNSWTGFDEFRRYGIKYWMCEREFPMKTNADENVITDLWLEFSNGDIYSGIMVGQMYEYLGEWLNAYKIYSNLTQIFDPITATDIENLLKIKTGLYRCTNLNNYEKLNSNNVHRSYSL